MQFARHFFFFFVKCTKIMYHNLCPLSLHNDVCGKKDFWKVLLLSISWCRLPLWHIHQAWPNYVWTCFLGCLWPEIHLHCEHGQNQLQKGWSWDPVCCSWGSQCCTGKTHCLIYIIVVMFTFLDFHFKRDWPFFIFSFKVTKCKITVWSQPWLNSIKVLDNTCL